MMSNDNHHGASLGFKIKRYKYKNKIKGLYSLKYER